MKKANEAQFSAFIRVLHNRYNNVMLRTRQDEALASVKRYAEEWISEHELENWMVEAYNITLRILSH